MLSRARACERRRRYRQEAHDTEQCRSDETFRAYDRLRFPRAAKVRFARTRPAFVDFETLAPAGGGPNDLLTLRGLLYRNDSMSTWSARWAVLVMFGGLLAVILTSGVVLQGRAGVSWAGHASVFERPFDSGADLLDRHKE